LLRVKEILNSAEAAANIEEPTDPDCGVYQNAQSKIFTGTKTARCLKI
jgi:hypothetical protein